ncbi:MAG TPA: pyridoxamine 5'-phosphate oxidase family protein [Nitrospirota bacterium]|nr:pyridoxamine 5'-phosphate oxidase family protein [Nitrospirota bacterium]
MRQAKKEITDSHQVIQLLNTCHVGRLGTIGRDGYPMVKPLNFAYHEGRIFFHSAREGEKIDDIKRDDRVCFEADLPVALVKSRGIPCRAEYLYRSVIVKGRARIVEDEAGRLFGLRLLMEKYQPEGGYGEFPDDKMKLTAIVRIDIEEMAGKEDLGKDVMREAALAALADGVHLPITLEMI